MDKTTLASADVQDLVEKMVSDLNTDYSREKLPQIKGAKSFPVAHISSRLIPLVKDQLLPDDKPEVFIVGGDGFYICSEHEENGWAEGLEQLIEKGCQVTYLLTNPESSTIERLMELKERVAAKGSEGGLHVIVPKDPPKSVARALDLWKTHHFVLFDNPRLLWLEGYHAPGSIVAHDCQFITRDNESGQKAWHLYKKAADSVVPYTEMVV